uniref:Uncharacterized protein n=1 Tax=Setaria italica TaxID=4555 RepID=K3YP29_SETIT
MLWLVLMWRANDSLRDVAEARVVSTALVECRVEEMRKLTLLTW